MSKVIVPQELQQKIIGLYVNEKKGINAIKKELKLPYSPQKIKETLIINNIKIRDVSEANNAKRKYTINDDYNFNSHNGAWILGILASDGYLPKTYGAQNKVVLTLQRQDENTLELIKQELEYTGPIYQFESNNGYPCSSLSFTSKSLRAKIESFGIYNAKTFTFNKIPDSLSKEYWIDFIRGYFDGDGSIYAIEKEKKIGMSFTSANQEILNSIAMFLSETYNLNIPKINSIQRVHIIYDIKYYKKDSLILGEIFYNNNYLSLIRKKQHFFALKDQFPIERNDIKKIAPTSLNTP